MQRKIDGRVYLMRDGRPVGELRKLHVAFVAKYGEVEFHKWLADRGKVHLEIKK